MKPMVTPAPKTEPGAPAELWTAVEIWQHHACVQVYYLSLKPQKPLLSQLLGADIPIDHSCGGYGTCGTCQAQVVWGLEFLVTPNELEREWQQDRAYPPQQRLMCQCELAEGVAQKPLLPAAEVKELAADPGGAQERPIQCRIRIGY